MANQFSNRKLFAAYLVRELTRQNILYPLFLEPTTQRQFLVEGASGGEMTFRLPPVVVAAFKGSADTVVTDYNRDEVVMRITEDDLAYAALGFNDVEATFSMNNREEALAFVNALGKGIGDAANLHLYDAALDVPSFVLAGGTLAAPTTPTDIAGVDAVAQKLDEQEAGETESRWLVADTKGFYAILGQDDFVFANVSGDTSAMTEGNFQGMKKRGFRFWHTEAVSKSTSRVTAVGRHTVGTFADVGVVAAPLVNGAVAVGDTTISFDGGVGAETLKRGDLFQVDAVLDSLGNPLQFAVTADAVAAAGAITASVKPESPAVIPNDAAVTFVGNHRKYLAGVPGGIVAAVIPPVRLMGTLADAIPGLPDNENTVAFINQQGMGVLLEVFGKDPRTGKQEVQGKSFAKARLIRNEFVTNLLGTY